MEALNRPVDPRSLHFGPLGLGGAMPADLQERLLREEMDALQLGEAVPAPVRSQFGKLRALYGSGLHSYESFTHAEREAYRVLEVALKIRFLEHYENQVPVTTDGKARLIECRRVDDLSPLLSSRRRGDGVVGHPSFDGSFAALLRWARAEGYFYGQFNRIREMIAPRMRNEIQHSEFDYLTMPPNVLWRIGLYFQWIQKLWGYLTTGANAYPGSAAARHG